MISYPSNNVQLFELEAMLNEPLKTQDDKTNEHQNIIILQQAVILSTTLDACWLARSITRSINKSEIFVAVDLADRIID